MNGERSRIYWLISNDNVAGVINTDEIGYFHQFEIFPKRVDPKRSGNSGSLTVIWPATPSASRSRPRTRSPAANRCFL